MSWVTKESDESKQDTFLALLKFWNSSISEMDESPVELLLSKIA